jgi:hypothetical protein
VSFTRQLVNESGDEGRVLVGELLLQLRSGKLLPGAEDVQDVFEAGVTVCCGWLGHGLQPNSGS